MNKLVPSFLSSINVDEIKFLEFYRYRTVVYERILSLRYDEHDDPYLDKLFDDIRAKADGLNFTAEDGTVRSGMQLRDNKTAFKIQLKSGTIVYVGYYDGARHIGLSVGSDDWIKPYPIKE